MSSYLQDTPDIAAYLKAMDLTRIVDLYEDKFTQKEKFAEAPKDYADAMDNYLKVLELVGDMAANLIEPEAESVDHEGVVLTNGEVEYAKGTLKAIQAMTKSDLMGFTLPREYKGLNMPKTIYSAAIEMISRADASLMNIFGLQEIADTISKFGSPSQKERYLPRFSTGEVIGGSMALTEPDAGSDLQVVMLKAHEQDGKWYLNGSKRFITNGCAKIALVLARSEENTNDGRGLSLFIYERDDKMKIRRIEDKLGIHGSPTCELQFDDAPAQLLGRRKMGLIKYTMSLMNGARLGVSAQAIGIAEAAYRAALKYSLERKQFKKRIIDFYPISEIITNMEVSLFAARALLYETAKVVDLKEGIEKKMEEHPQSSTDLAGDLKKYTKWASYLTPLLKFYTTEMCNRITYEAIAVHGGVGFTREFPVERHYRDARITSIYEGTTQLQVVAAINGVQSGLPGEIIGESESVHQEVLALKDKLEQAVAYLKSKGPKFVDFHARRLVDISSDVMIAFFMNQSAYKKENCFELFLKQSKAKVASNLEYIYSMEESDINLYNR